MQKKITLHLSMLYLHKYTAFTSAFTILLLQELSIL